MTTDRIKGAAKDAAGKGKEKAGKATDNDDLKAEGRADQGEGKVQGAVGKGKEKLNDIKNKVK